MKKSLAIMAVMFLTAFPAAAGNGGSNSDSGTAQSAPANSSTGQGIKNDAREAKQGVKSTAQDVKEGVKSGAREVKYGVKTAWAKVKDFFKN